MAERSSKAFGPSSTRIGASIPLRLRLTLWVVLIFSILQWASVGVFWLYKQAGIDTLFDRGILTRAEGIAERIRDLLPGIEDAQLIEIASHELRHTQFRPFVVEIFDQTGRPVTTRSAHLDPVRVGVDDVLATGVPDVRQEKLTLVQDQDPGSSIARVAAVPISGANGEPFVVVLAADHSYVRRQRAQVAWVLIVTGSVGTAAAAISGWLIGGLAVAPLERVRELAAGLGPESLKQTIETPGESAEVARLARELDDARARLNERFEAQDRFLSNVSHEIKTPISVLLTEAQTLDRAGIPEHAQQFITSARDEMSRLGHLVESFLTLSRIEDGKGLARFRDLPVNDLIVNSVSDNRLMANQHRVRLHVNVLDEPDMDVAVAGEPELLSTMVGNIVRNAIRFSPENGRIDIGADRSDGVVHIRVRDQGPGIPADRLHTIFDRFAQAHAGERRGRGHGLGLAIAKGIAELHRGTITASNIEGGCQFTISLPVSHRSRPQSGAVEA